MIVATAIVAGLIASVIGVSVFAGGPYDNAADVPGYAEYTTQEGGSIEAREITFRYKVYDKVDEITVECSYNLWSTEDAEEEVPAELLEGYTLAMDDLNPPHYNWFEGDDGFMVLDHWEFSDDEGNTTGETVNSITDDDYGKTLAPVYRPATEEETAEFEALIAEMEKEQEELEAEREANGVAGYTWTWEDENGPQSATEYYLASEINVVVTPLTGQELADAIAKAGSDSGAITAFDVKLYAEWDDEHQFPLFVREGKTVHVSIPKPDIKGATKFAVTHVKADGSTEELAATVNGDTLEFDTPSCSAFIPHPSPDPAPTTTTVAETTTTAAETTTTTAAPVTTGTATKNPGTGEGSYLPVIILCVVSFFAAAAYGTALFIKKRKIVEE